MSKFIKLELWGEASHYAYIEASQVVSVIDLPYMKASAALNLPFIGRRTRVDLVNGASHLVQETAKEIVEILSLAIVDTVAK